MLVIVALLGLIAVPTTTLGQEKDNAKPDAAKSKDKGNKAPKGQQTKDAGQDKGSGDAKSKLDRLGLAMAKELKLTSTQKENVRSILRKRQAGTAAHAKAKEKYDAEHGVRFKALQARVDAAKKARNEERLKVLSAEVDKAKEAKAKALEKFRLPKIGEVFAKIEKILQPTQIEPFRKLLVELKFVASQGAGTSLSPKDFIKSIMSKSVGLSDKQKETLKVVYKSNLAKIKTAAKNKAAIEGIKKAFREEVKAVLKDQQWQAALTSLTATEKKIAKEAKAAAKAAQGKGKAGKKPQAKDAKKAPDKNDKKGNGKKKGQ